MFRSVVTVGMVLFAAAVAMGQSSPQTIQSGYAIVTPSSPTATGIVAFENLILARVNDTLEVNVTPPNLTTNMLMPVDISSLLSETLGVSLVNPNAGNVNVTMTLMNADGTTLASTSFILGAHRQTSKLITEYFPTTPVGGFST